MTDGVFIVRDDNALVEMRSSPFESEDLLRELRATNTSLIAGDAVNPTNPRRWLLIAREQAVPGEAGGAGRWSLDHLFVDQNGVPTLVGVVGAHVDAERLLREGRLDDALAADQLTRTALPLTGGCGIAAISSWV